MAATVAVVVAAIGCGKPAAGSVAPRDRDVLTHDEIVSNAREGSDLLETVQALRPHFLMPPPGIQRGSAPRGITVYINERLAGGAETLRDLTAGSVDEVRYLGPTESRDRFGQTATLVTLMIRLRRARADTTFGGRVDGWTGGQVDRWTGGQVDRWTGDHCRRAINRHVGAGA